MLKRPLQALFLLMAVGVGACSGSGGNPATGQATTTGGLVPTFATRHLNDQGNQTGDGSRALSKSALENADRLLSTPKPLVNTPNFHLGVELATMGIIYPNHTYADSYNAYFSPTIMSEIKNTLHLKYVRSGFEPRFMRINEAGGYGYEDNFMDNACQAGLGVMVIVPPPSDDELATPAQSLSDTVSVTKTFFARYKQREPGCAIEAEIENEADINPNNPFTAADLSAYVFFFSQVEPYIMNLGYSVITSGTSGLDTNWTNQLYHALSNAHVGTSLYGYHPYVGTSASNPNANSATIIASEIQTMANAEDQVGVAITEFGSNSTQNRAADLTATIENASPYTTFFTVYTYREPLNAVPGASAFGLKEHADLYSAVQQAAIWVTTNPTPPPATPTPAPTHTPICKCDCSSLKGAKTCPLSDGDHTSRH